MPANEGEEQLFYEQWRDRGFDSVLYKSFHTWANQDEQLIQIAEKPSPLPSGACSEPWVGCTILADGTVVPCCNDYAAKLQLGDLKTQSLREIWNGPQMTQLRRRFTGEKPDLAGTICAECRFPVASRREAETGAGPFDPITREFGAYLTGSEEMPPLNPEDPHLVEIIVRPPEGAIRPEQTFTCAVCVVNRSLWSLRSTGSTPVYLSYHWLENGGGCVTWDGQRTPLVPELPAGGREVYGAKVIAPDRPGEFVLRMSLVQEQVAWFENWDPRNASSCPIIIHRA
jgi:radical SAM protein with 4Fe4S-binding SPASM domain